MPKLAPLALLAAALLGCGGSPTRAEAAERSTEATPERPTDTTRPAEASDSDDAPAAPTMDAPAAAPEVDALVQQLGSTPLLKLPEAVDAAPVARLRPALQKLPEGSPAHAWASLRVARALIHVRRFREAQGVLDGIVNADGTVANAVNITRKRLRARATARAGVVGVLLPLSGPFGAIGQSARPAIEIAAQQAGVKLVVRDTAGDADQAARATARLVYEDGVAGIVGPIGAIESEAAALVAERLGVPLMALTSDAGFADLGAYIFRHRLTRTAQARAVAAYAINEMSLETFAILYPDTDYGREMMRAFWDAVVEMGGEIRGAQSYGAHDRKFDTPLKKLVGRHHLEARAEDLHWKKMNRKARDKGLHVPPIVDFEAVFIPEVASRASMVLSFLPYWDIELKTAPDLNPRIYRRKYGGRTPQLVQVLGGNGLNHPRFVQRAGSLGRNAVFVDAVMPRSRDVQSFERAYRERAERPPAPLAAHAYDATRLMASATQGRTDRDAVRQALLDAGEHETLFGASRMSQSGEVQVPLTMLTIDKSGAVIPRREEATDLLPSPADEDAPPSN